MGNKILWAFVPACISFGPLFMTGIGGLGSDSVWLKLSGSFMLSLGLIAIVFRLRDLEKLRPEESA